MMKLSDRGFTLIEALVVVAIAAILIRVAIPAYEKRSSIARQAFAKSSLTAVYTAEKAFLAEQISFTGCLAMIGVAKPSAVQEQYYSFGFLNPTGSLCGPSPSTTSCLTSNFSTGTTCTDTENSTYFKAGIYANATHATPSNALLVGSVMTAYYFIAVASGQIARRSTTNDVWMIDSRKILLNASPSL